MAIKLRLARHGKKKSPYYRIVASEDRARRDGRFLEQLGTYDPKLEPPGVTLKRDRIRYWLGKGAKPTDTVGSILGRYLDGEDTVVRVVRRPPAAAPKAAPEAEAGAEAAAAVAAAEAEEPAAKAEEPAAEAEEPAAEAEEPAAKAEEPAAEGDDDAEGPAEKKAEDAD